MNDRHAAALEYADNGWPVIPLDGKRPWVRNWQTTGASEDGDQIDAWWQERPASNVGVQIPAGHIVVDLDGQIGIDSWATLQLDNGEAPQTMTIRTGSGGLHLWYVLPADVPSITTVSSLAAKIDTRGAGSGQVVMPPSIHPKTGRAYLWECDDPPAPAPDWLCSLLRRHSMRAVDDPPLSAGNPWIVADEVEVEDAADYLAEAVKRAAEKVRSSSPGERAAETYKQASYLGRLCAGSDLDEDAVGSALVAANADNGRLREDGLRAIERDVSRGLTYGRQRPRRLVERRRDVAPMSPTARIAWPVVHERGPHRGRPIKTRIENSRAMLAAYGVAVRYDLMRHRIDIAIPGFMPAAERRANASLDWLRTMAQGHGLDKDAILDHLTLEATEFHPVLDWIRSCPWDGLDRMADLVDTIETSDDLAPELIKRWVRQCAAALVVEDFRPSGVLVLQGLQGGGKTTWCARLAPPSDWVAIGMNIDPSNRDSVQAVTRHWIAELGELDATFRKADVAALKAFVDRGEDVYRAAYARREERIPRRTVLFASVNRPDFLHDETGNRRWWVVKTDRCRWNHEIDTQQLWAQALAEVEAGEPWRLGEFERQLSERNRRFEPIDPLIDSLWQTWETVADPSESDWHSIGSILHEMPAADDRPGKREVNMVARALRMSGADGVRDGRTRRLLFPVRKLHR